jgi:hypothetical protein
MHTADAAAEMGKDIQLAGSCSSEETPSLTSGGKPAIHIHTHTHTRNVQTGSSWHACMQAVEPRSSG